MQKDLLHLFQDSSLVSPGRQEFLRRISDLSESMGVECYLAGGSVRDILLGKPLKDLDLVIEADAITLANALLNKYGGTLEVHRDFGTAVWAVDDAGVIDLITARSETYTFPGALPTVKPSTIVEDLSRRDFTINAMALRMRGGRAEELIDNFNGQTDLENGVIRVLHSRSFIDDPTRILRAIRYEQRYGFTIEAGTRDGINAESLRILSTLSGERIRHEFDLIFGEAQSAPMMLRAGEMGLMRAFDPALPELNPRYAHLLASIPPPEFKMRVEHTFLGASLWLIDCSSAQVGGVIRRLGFPRELSDNILAAVDLKKDLPGMSAVHKPSAWTARLEQVPQTAIYAVWLVSGQDDLREYLVTWRHIHPRTTGHHLRELGLPPGPRYREILGQLRTAWLDKEVKNEQEEREMLKTLL